MNHYLDPDEQANGQASSGAPPGLANDVRAGLTVTPKTLPPKYFYDAAGSALFEQITRLAEYYPTRTEAAILAERAEEIANLTRAATLVEIGSGTSEKTRLLLAALRDAGTLLRFVPFDVDPVVLSQASTAITADFDPIEVEPIVGDFEQHLPLLPRHPQRLVAFLGSTIGNLEPAARQDFLRALRTNLGADEWFLLGIDLVKAPERLLAAYDDPGGVTAAFNKNVLAVLNRELGAHFDLDAFDHVVRWDAEREWIEMRLRAVRPACIHIEALGLDVPFAAGEDVRTEISAKFTEARVTEELATAGLRMVRWWTDPAQDFALSLAKPASANPVQCVG